MAFDQNSVPKGLRPLNVDRSEAEEPCIAVAATANQGFFSSVNPDSCSPGSIPVFYPAVVPDSGFVDFGYGAAVAAVPGNPWGSHMPVLTPVGHTGVKQVIGYDCSPNLGNMVVGNASVQANGDTGAGFVYAHKLGNRVGGSPRSDQMTGNNELPLGYGSNPNLGSRGCGGAVDHASDEGADDPACEKKVKFLCSFGGKILPRPCDGMLRYVGGQTRIISVRRDINFNELDQKMAYAHGQLVVIKYQLPDEDLDALVSVSCPDDLDNMMEEYDKLVERSLDGSAKLRLFLFLASELDTSGLVQFGDSRDSGQRYVEAVNGIMEGRGGGGIMRKESIASQTSTQSSDFSGSEAVDGLFPGQGDANGPPSISNLSPRGNSGISHEIASTMVCVDSVPTIHADVSAVSVGMPVMKSNPLNLSSQPEVEAERAAPLTIPTHQMVVDVHQRGGDIPQSGHYIQAHMDPQQELINRTDYLHLPSQIGFPGQLLGHAALVFNQQQPFDNAAGFTSQQFIPAMHMTMAPSSSHVGIRPTMVQPLMQSQQTRLEQYPDERTSGTRVVQVPIDQSYNLYPPQFPSAVVGGPYAWPQITASEHVVISDGMMPHQQKITPAEHAVVSDGAVPHQHMIIPQKIPNMDDCNMFQKALPHAHSDPLAQDQRDSGACIVSDSNSVYHSLLLDDVKRTQPLNRVMVTGTLGEGVPKQITGPQTRIFSIDHQFGVPQSEADGFSQNVEGQHENEQIHKKLEHSDHPRVPVTHGVMGLAGDVQPSYGVIMGAISLSSQEDAVLQQQLPPQYQVNEEALVNKHVNSNVPHVGLVHVKSSERLVHEHPKDNSGKLPALVSKNDTVNPSTSSEHLRPIDGMMDALQIFPAEFKVFNDQNKLPVENFRKEHIMDGRTQPLGGRDVPLYNAFSQPLTVLDTDQMKVTELLASSNAKVHMHNPRLLESYEVAQPPVYQQSKIGIQHLDSGEVRCGNPASTATEPAHLADRFPPAADWKDEVSHLQPKIVLSDAGAVLANVNKSSLLPSARDGDAQDSSNSLFSNQDPWNFQQDTHFPPPRPNRLRMKKEGFPSREPLNDNHLGQFGELITDVQLEKAIYQPLNVENKDFNSEHSSSKKGSAEELIKQELQAVAEGVAASVFLSTTQSNPDSSALGKDESGYGNDHEIDVQDSDVERQHKAKLEGFKNKVPEKANVGFPVSDGIGRLQIIKNSDLEELRELGSGTFGTVYHGKWRGTDVAIKRINDRCFAGKPSEQERMIDDFWNEAIKLADLHHPNVVASYGVVLDGPGGSVATVTEYMVNGSLRNALQKNERNLDMRKRLLIAMDVAFGMEYLHGKNIVHFDLKSDNLLVNLRDPHRPICKVGDLGLSKVKCQTLISGGVRGTLPWMAPELLNGSSSLVSEKVDVFSFGIVLWELLTGDEPYADLHYGAIIGGIVSNTLRPPVPESCDPEWRSLMERCWSSEPSERPVFTEIANELRSMAAKTQPKGQNTPQPCSQPQVHK